MCGWIYDLRIYGSISGSMDGVVLSVLARENPYMHDTRRERKGKESWGNIYILLYNVLRLD